ncbi:MAG: hypothetical protein AAFZ01_15090, partial [Pseudomonadota bacterium]
RHALRTGALALVGCLASVVSVSAESPRLAQKPPAIAGIGASGDPIAALIARERRTHRLPKNFRNMVGQMIMVGFLGTSARSAGT